MNEYLSFFIKNWQCTHSKNRFYRVIILDFYPMKIEKISLLIVFFLSTAITVSFSSCEKDKIETIPLESVSGEVLEMVDYGDKVFNLVFLSDLDTYPLSYVIRNQVSISGDQINVNLIDIEKDGHDDVNVIKGQLTATIALGTLSEGLYNVQINVGGSMNEGTLNITGDQVVLDFSATEKLTILHDTLNRIPFGTVWGYCGYQNSNNAYLATAFIDGLDGLGAVPAELTPGYYGYFSIGDSSTFVQPIDQGFSYYKEYLRSYTGDATEMNELVGHYNAEYASKMDIIFYWFYDGN